MVKQKSSPKRKAEGETEIFHKNNVVNMEEEEDVIFVNGDFKKQELGKQVEFKDIKKRLFQSDSDLKISGSFSLNAIPDDYNELYTNEDDKICSCKIDNFQTITKFRPDIEYFSFNTNLQDVLDKELVKLGKVLVKENILSLDEDLKEFIGEGDVKDYDSDGQDYIHTCVKVYEQLKPVVKLVKLDVEKKLDLPIEELLEKQRLIKAGCLPPSALTSYQYYRISLHENKKPEKKPFFTKKSTGGKGYVKPVKSKPGPKCFKQRLAAKVIEESKLKKPEKPEPAKKNTNQNEIYVDGEIEGLKLCFLHGDIVPVRRSRRHDKPGKPESDDSRDDSVEKEKNKKNKITFKAKKVTPKKLKQETPSKGSSISEDAEFSEPIETSEAKNLAKKPTKFASKVKILPESDIDSNDDMIKPSGMTKRNCIKDSDTDSLDSPKKPTIMPRTLRKRSSDDTKAKSKRPKDSDTDDEIIKDIERKRFSRVLKRLRDSDTDSNTEDLDRSTRVLRRRATEGAKPSMVLRKNSINYAESDDDDKSVNVGQVDEQEVKKMPEEEKIISAITVQITPDETVQKTAADEAIQKTTAGEALQKMNTDAHFDKPATGEAIQTAEETVLKTTETETLSETTVDKTVQKNTADETLKILVQNKTDKSKTKDKTEITNNSKPEEKEITGKEKLKQTEVIDDINIKGRIPPSTEDKKCAEKEQPKKFKKPPMTSPTESSIKPESKVLQEKPVIQNKVQEMNEKEILGKEKPKPKEKNKINTVEEIKEEVEKIKKEPLLPPPQQLNNCSNEISTKPELKPMIQKRAKETVPLSDKEKGEKTKPSIAEAKPLAIKQENLSVKEESNKQEKPVIQKGVKGIVPLNDKEKGEKTKPSIAEAKPLAIKEENSSVKEEPKKKESSIPPQKKFTPSNETVTSSSKLKETTKIIKNEDKTIIKNEIQSIQNDDICEITPMDLETPVSSPRPSEESPTTCRDPRLRARLMSRDEEVRLLKAKKLAEEALRKEEAEKKLAELKKEEAKKIAEAKRLEPKKKRKSIDTELLYKTPLSDLHSDEEERSSYQKRKILTVKPMTRPLTKNELIALDLKKQFYEETLQLKSEMKAVEKKRLEVKHLLPADLSFMTPQERRYIQEYHNEDPGPSSTSDYIEQYKPPEVPSYSYNAYENQFSSPLHQPDYVIPKVVNNYIPNPLPDYYPVNTVRINTVQESSISHVQQEVHLHFHQPEHPMIQNIPPVSEAPCPASPDPPPFHPDPRPIPSLSRPRQIPPALKPRQIPSILNGEPQYSKIQKDHREPRSESPRPERGEMSRSYRGSSREKPREFFHRREVRNEDFYRRDKPYYKEVRRHEKDESPYSRRPQRESYDRKQYKWHSRSRSRSPSQRFRRSPVFRRRYSRSKSPEPSPRYRREY